MTALCTVLWVILGDVPQFIGLHMNMNEKIKRKQLKYLPLLLINLVFLILALILSTDDALVRIGFTIAYYSPYYKKSHQEVFILMTVLYYAIS